MSDLLENQRKSLWEHLKELPPNDIRGRLHRNIAMWLECATIDYRQGRQSLRAYIERAKGAVFMACDLHVVHAQESSDLIDEIESWATKIPESTKR